MLEEERGSEITPDINVDVHTSFYHCESAYYGLLPLVYFKHHKEVRVKKFNE